MAKRLGSFIVGAGMPVVMLFGSQHAAAVPDVPPADFRLAAGMAAMAANPRGDAAPPGADDWSCRPSAAHPNPVVLLHGQFENQTITWQAMAPLLHHEGYCVFSTNWGERSADAWPSVAVKGRLPIEQGAAEVADFVERVRIATGAEQVDFVTHSMGGLVGGYYVKFLGGADRVARFVAIAAPWNGSDHLGMSSGMQLLGAAGSSLRTAAESALGELSGPLPQVLTSSAFMSRMRSGGFPTVPEVAYTNLISRYDEVVVPFTSSIVEAPNVRNIVVQDGCEQDLADHLALVVDPVTSGHVLAALDPDRRIPVQCVPVLPLVGS